jgi:hypothetical protein
VPPPAYGSPEFEAAVAEVRRYSDARTQRQLDIAKHWGDGAGSYTPAGHWNEIAADLVTWYNLPEHDAAHVLAVVNMAMMDAGIAVWDAKYTYWLLRPSQADPAITTPIGLPNFPSYVSGHAAFSGAASEVLGYFFPAERAALRAQAEEAAMSRLYAGIHYRFDSEVGLGMGRAVGAIAVERERALGGRTFTNRVLTPSDMDAIDARRARINDHIRAQATEHGYAYFALSALYDLPNPSFDVRDVLFSDAPFGPSISLDGAHPSAQVQNVEMEDAGERYADYNLLRVGR